MPDVATIDVTQSVTIANGTTTSGALNCSAGRTLVGLTLPAAFTGTALTFTTSTTSSGAYVDVYQAGGSAAYSVTVGTSRYVPVDPAVFKGCKFVKVVSGSTEGGSRSITCHLRVVQ